MGIFCLPKKYLCLSLSWLYEKCDINIFKCSLDFLYPDIDFI